jgi:oligopeptide/dipeptide ABC transporter ATP-binding protein
MRWIRTRSTDPGDGPDAGDELVVGDPAADASPAGRGRAQGDLDVELLPGRDDWHGPLLEVRDLSVSFTTDEGVVHAVDSLSFEVRDEETLGIVGESGSGKSVTSMAILGLLPRSATVTGEILFRGRNLLGLREKALESIRGREIAMIFQDALTSLNPVFTVGSQIAEAISAHNDIPDAEVDERVVELLALVGIPNPRERSTQYPHEFSGGMRQRAMIAMSIANEPAVLIADEPTTALDVTIQAQVLDVLERIQDRTQSSIMLITHDLGVVAGVADRVMVMYAGRQAEVGGIEDIFYEPAHPYTKGLLASLPRFDRRTGDRLHRIVGQPPSLIHRPPGCAFHPRCPRSEVPGLCNTEVPPLVETGVSHSSACHFAAEVQATPLEEIAPPEEIVLPDDVLPSEVVSSGGAAPSGGPAIDAPADGSEPSQPQGSATPPEDAP